MRIILKGWSQKKNKTERQVSQKGMNAAMTTKNTIFQSSKILIFYACTIFTLMLAFELNTSDEKLQS
jgi:hypothetical protein